MKLPPGRRIASIIPSTGQRASTTKPRREVLDRLVVDAVDDRLAHALEDLREARAGDELDRVDVAVVDLGVAVLERLRPLRADVLQQRSAESDVHQLQAAADAEHRLAALGERGEERPLVIVADAVAAPLRLQRRLAVARRRDVGAAFEDERVEPVGVVGERDVALLRVAGRARDHHRDRAARHHPVGDRLLDVLQRLAGEDRPRRIGVEEARRDADLDAVLSSHRLREQPLEVRRRHRLRIGLVADVGRRDLDQARDRLALDADRRQVRRDADRLA